MATSKVNYVVTNIRGEHKGLDIFQYFDDGIRKRLPKLIADKVMKSLLKNIDKNRYNFQLSPDWVAYKKRIGADERPFLMFGYYKRAIQIVTSNGHLSVGFKKSAVHPRAGITMARLAVALEYGDLARNRIARPLWRNTMADFVKDNSGLPALVKKELNEGRVI